MTNNTVRLHRVFSASPEKVYKAFIDLIAMAAWLPPYGFYALFIAWIFALVVVIICNSQFLELAIAIHLVVNI